jgi:tagatose 1,6-diphosphate aldolase
MSQSNGREHFRNLPPGKLMGLRQITDGNDKFKVLALDQSGAFNDAFKNADNRSEKVSEAKLRLTKVIGARASSVLLDVRNGLRQAVNGNHLPQGVGLIGRLEKSVSGGMLAYEEPGWSVAKIKRMGCHAVKVLVYMDVEDEKYTTAQMDFVKRACDACAEHDILLMTEELSFARSGEDKSDYAQRRVKNILKSTELIGSWTDILKLEYPGDDHVKELNDSAVRPWVLLSAGGDFDVFEKQTAAAMKAGASGFMAGRAIFKEWLNPELPDAYQKSEFLVSEATRRIQVLDDLVDAQAQSWLKRYDLTWDDMAKSVDFHWYSAQSAGVPAPTGY